MEHTSRSSNGVTPWGYSSDADRLALPTILLVEDDRDTREMLSTMLDMAGFAVVACDSAEVGLNALREQDFDLVLTDYALPRQSGTWLLQNAEAEGLLHGTPVLIVTAHPNVESANAYEIIQKPFDLDDLVERVRHRLHAGERTRSRRPSSLAPKDGHHGDEGGGGTGCPRSIELILYVSANSPKAAAAVSTIRRLIESFTSSTVTLTVCHLPETARGVTTESVGDRTDLVRHNVGARTLIMGHSSNPEPLLELLADCEADW